MMKTIKSITAIVFLMNILSGLFTANIFASTAELEAIEKLTATEKAGPQEKMERPAVEYKAGNFRDPFQTPILKDIPRGGEVERDTVAEAALPSLALQGVIWGGRFPQAVINNQVVKVGDTTIEGAQVAGINKNGVVVLFQNKQYNLTSPAGEAIYYEESKGGKHE